MDYKDIIPIDKLTSFLLKGAYLWSEFCAQTFNDEKERQAWRKYVDEFLDNYDLTRQQKNELEDMCKILYEQTYENYNLLIK